MTKYQPIDCNYYDRLEAWSTRNEMVKILFWEDGKQKEIEAIIQNIYTKNKEEFLVLNNGLEIRLDHLIAVNGIPVPNAC
ncbi:hypothetical protein QQ008_16610 [Fulvivirgaceae bacterium BMA10]|uniref:Rho-binding antiterminator n=1 Tax=Splendidivirga corallicola TaxID=3051826 RepID=A0ABT8KQI8_9BACT|nr:hypothetical protein [Fulvivirgaceae bacterium BMA10]